jgi:lipid II:glycine glycyltransferase (peptidoglycan interpeptide bridge formation enzyme)
MIARRILDSELNSFFELQLRSNEVFASNDWSEAYGDQLVRIGIFNDTNQLVGGLVAFEQKKFGLTQLITPPFAPHCGWFFFSEKKTNAKLQADEKQAAEAIADFLKKSNYHFYKLEFPTSFNDAQPLIWKGITVKVKYTYLLDLKASQEEMFQAMDSKLRNKLSKDFSDFQLDQNRNGSDAFQLFSATMKRSNVKIDEPILQNLMQSSALNFTFIRKESKAIGMALFAGQGNKCYYLFGAIDRDRSNDAVGPKSLYEAILYAKRSGFEYFDFEGSMVPGIESYFRQFGGVLTPLYSINGGRGAWPRLFSIYYNL